MVKKKYVCIPRSFLVINFCNEGKTLCSLCITGYVASLSCTLSSECNEHHTGHSRPEVSTKYAALHNSTSEEDGYQTDTYYH
jgi:hypothetical protein